MRRSFIGLVLGVSLAAVPAASLALTVDLEVETVYVDPRTHEVVLAGTVTCDAGASLQIGFVVTQGPATAGGFETMACTGAGQAWELREPTGTPRLHAGPATLDFGFTAELDGEGVASGRSVDAFIAPAGAKHLFAVKASA